MWVFMLGFLGFPLTGGSGEDLRLLGRVRQGLVVADRDRRHVHDGLRGLLPAVAARILLRDSAELHLAPAGGSPPRELLLGNGVAICVIVSVGSFFFVQPLVDLAAKAAAALPF